MLSLLVTLLTLLSLSLAAPQIVSITSTATAPALQPTSTSSPTTATSADDCISDNFVSPWIISNLVITAPIDGTDGRSAYISFSFYDPNEALQLSTMCLAQVTDGSVKTPTGGYVGCQDQYVRFQFEDDKTLLLSRWYEDPCKGEPPYDNSIAYGESEAAFQVISTEGGDVRFQQQMLMNVTRMS